MAATPVRVSASGETLEVRFQRLAAAWQEAVGHHSSSRKRYHHPLYLEIISLGSEVVPLLLHDLAINGRHWFAALSAITGENPVRPDHAGAVALMTQDWLHWAKEKGLQW